MKEKKIKISNSLLIFLAFITAITSYINVNFSGAKYSSDMSKSSTNRIALFAASMTENNNTNEMTLLGIDKPNIIYEFKINNDSEVAVSSSLIIRLKNNIESNNDYNLQIRDKNSNEVFKPLSTSTNNEKKFNLGNMLYNTSKEYYLEIYVDNYNMLQEKQQIKIVAESLIVQID